MKYRLRKDLPDLEAGEIFDDTDSFGHEAGSMFDSRGTYRFEKDDIKHFDEWFEEIKESGWWKPKNGEEYYAVSSHGVVGKATFDPESKLDCEAISMGNVFKTKESAKAYAEYLKAVATVRQDEGVIDLQGIREEYEATPENKYDEFCVYTVAFNLYLRKLVVTDADEYISANAIWFDTVEHAQASLDKHPGEWKIIANYDWRRE